MPASEVERPTQLQFSAAKRVLRYLKGIADEVMIMCSGKDDQVTAFTDVSCGLKPKRTEVADIV